MDALPEILALSQIVLIDVALAGDNAIAIGMAAAGLPAAQRRLAIIRGIIAAAVLRILFAIFAVQMLHIIGLLVVGGLLLLWVAWKMYREIRHMQIMHENKSHGPDGAGAGDDSQSSGRPKKKLSDAIVQIAVADISMSLDNVLAVAGVARDHMLPLVVGLTLSVLLMGVAATFVARLITRFRWVAWAGLILVLYTALRMIWEGSRDLLQAMA